MQLRRGRRREARKAPVAGGEMRRQPVRRALHLPRPSQTRALAQRPCKAQSRKGTREEHKNKAERTQQEAPAAAAAVAPAPAAATSPSSLSTLDCT
jgi:hypothetical protein